MVRLGQTSLLVGRRDYDEDAGKSVDAEPAAVIAASTSTAANRRCSRQLGLQQQMVARDGGRVQESGGARNGRVDDSSGPLVKGTSVKPESLSGEGRQASLAGSYPGVRVAGQAPVEDVPRRVGQREGRSTIRGFGAAR